MNALIEGDEFTKRDSRPYTLADGTRGTHEFALRCRVVAIGERGFDWERVEVLTEAGRPEGFADNPAERGSMAWFGLDAALARGDIEVTARA